MKSPDTLYNLDFLKQVYNSDSEIIDQIRQIFLENIPKYINDLDLASEEQNWAAISFTAHKIKSSIRLFNINQIIEEVVEIENHSKAMTELDGLPNKIKHVTMILKQVEVEMKQASSGIA